MRESTIERKLVAYCKAKGLLCYKFSSPAHRGVPDRIILGQGKVLFLELKATGCKPSALQLREIERIRVAGVGAAWCDSEDLGKEAINSWFFGESPMTTPESPVPAKVEPRHLELADELINSHVDASHSMRSAAQLIADSEAQATAELRAELERTRLALKPIEASGEGSGPEFAHFFENAAKSPIYWTKIATATQERLIASEAQVQKLMKDRLRLKYLISHINYANGMLCEFTEFSHQMDAHNGNVRKAIDAAIAHDTH